jgi:predicted amidohydrolase YtcJ
MKSVVVIFAVLSLMTTSQAQFKKPSKSEPPDAIYINGNIYTGLFLSGKDEQPVSPQQVEWKLDGLQPYRVEAMAVRGDRVIAIGSNAQVRALGDKQTRIVDLKSRFLMPGFNDAHLHLASGGLEKLNVDLVGVKSLEEMKARITERAKTTAQGQWIQGAGWDETVWPDQKLPTRQDIDAVTGDHPAVFVRVDGHIAVANSAALKAAGITKSTPAPIGGKIDHDASGEPTGILRESAKDELLARVPAPTPSQRRRAIELAVQDAARHGITSVQDNSEWDDFLTYEDLERDGKLTVRICEWLPFNASINTLDVHRAHHEQNDLMLHTGMLKGFLDGSLGSRTAAMLKPYSDDPNNTGLPQYKQPELDEMADQRAASRYQMGFHAIGDAATELALNAFEAAERYAREHDVAGLGPDPSKHEFRFRVEHAQVVTPEQIARFRKLQVIASMQPNHLLTDMNWAVDRIGPERAKTSYAWKSFLDAGVMLAFGTDYPVEPITPFRGLYAAVTRKNEQGTKEYYPEEKISITQAITAYTSGAAFAEFAEDDKGTLAPGMLADFVVLDVDITRVAPPEILKTKVLRTVVGGNTVFEAGK